MHAKLVQRVRHLREWRKEQLAVMVGPMRGLGVDLAGEAWVGGGKEMEEVVKRKVEDVSVG